MENGKRKINIQPIFHFPFLLSHLIVFNLAFLNISNDVGIALCEIMAQPLNLSPVSRPLIFRLTQLHKRIFTDVKSNGSIYI
jgi:hypothetical protein